MSVPPDGTPYTPGKEIAVEVLMVMLVVGVILWATGHLVMH